MRVFGLVFITLIAMYNQKVSEQSMNNWVKKTYKIEGNWTIETNGNQSSIVFGEDFRTSRGPDVKVYLSPKKIEDIGKRESVDKKGLYLGVMRRFSGAQSFTIPINVNLEDYNSVVLHCQAYSVVWGGANLR